MKFKNNNIRFTLFSLLIVSIQFCFAQPGTTDPTFFSYNSDGPLNVETTALQSDGKIIIGGTFTTIGGVSQRRIARLNTDGTLDNTFNIGTGAAGNIYKLLVQPDDKIVVASGPISSFNGITVNKVCRLNSNGRLDNSFSVPVYNGIGIFSFDSFGRFYALIDSSSGLNSFRKVIRLQSNGSRDYTFNDLILPSGSSIYGGGVTNDGKIIVIGDFTWTQTNSQGIIINQRKNTIRLNSNGEVDLTFSLNNVWGNSGTPQNLCIQPDGKIILLCTTSTNISGVSTLLIRLNPDASIDMSVPYTNYGMNLNNAFWSIALQADGKILIGIENIGSANSNRKSIARFNSDGTFDVGFAAQGAYLSGTGGRYVKSITVQNDGKIIAAGQYNGFNSLMHRGITRLNGGDCTTPPPTALSIQEFCESSIGLTIDTLNVNSQNVKVYSSNTSMDPMFPSTSIIDNTTYYVSQILGCESTQRTPILVRIHPIPTAPNGNTNQTFCNSASVSDLNLSGTQVLWYSSPSSGNPLDQSALLVNGSNYYASQTVNSCESQQRLAVTVTINNPSPPTGTASQTFCNSATVNNLSAIGTSIQWYNAASGGTVLTSSTSLVNGQTYYATQTVNNCESQQRFAVSVTINSPAAPTGNATQVFCSGSVVSDLSANGTNLKWYSAPSDGVSLPINSILMDGAFYYGSQTINNCESQNRFAVNVNLTPLPSNIVQQTNYTLIANQQGATYQWIHCNNGFQIIPNENQISYTPITGGSYAVQVTLNGCTNTSECITAITANLNENEYSFIINLYPNPNSGTFTFETTLTGKYLVMNNLGQIITEFNVEYPSQKEVTLDTPSKGVYYIKHTENQTRPTKLIVQ